MKVLFWGTPEFAAPPLRALLGEGFDVVGVVTQPDKPQGRSRSSLVPSPIKEIAVGEGLPVLQPERPRGAEFIEQVRRLESDISVVVAYGHILPRDVIDLPANGTVNVHASLLPAWRGAAPIQASIRSCATETGVTIMRMVPALDAGPILLQQTIPIADDETHGELQARLSELGALALIESLALISIGRAVETPQDNTRATFAPKVEREDTRIDWALSAREVSCLIRAFDPRPGAFTTLDGQEVKLFGARVSADDWPPPGSTIRPGTVGEIGELGMFVACGSGAVRVADAQAAGKRRLSADEWRRGRGVREGSHFGA
jgi:methionyl-tRNA formyltransferase